MNNFWRFGFSVGSDDANEREGSVCSEASARRVVSVTSSGTYASVSPEKFGAASGNLISSTGGPSLAQAELDFADDLDLAGGPAGERQVETFRSLVRRSHLLQSRQLRRAVASRRAAACEAGHASERLVLALADAE
ncbi:unnamed protein product, partial [Polarella glacialis]